MEVRHTPHRGHTHAHTLFCKHSHTLEHSNTRASWNLLYVRCRQHDHGTRTAESVISLTPLRRKSTGTERHIPRTLRSIHSRTHNQSTHILAHTIASVLCFITSTVTSPSPNSIESHARAPALTRYIKHIHTYTPQSSSSSTSLGEADSLFRLAN